MSFPAGTDAGRMTSELPASRVKGLRRAALTAFVLLLIQYGLGCYAGLYVTIPGADHGKGIGAAISNGPAALSAHAVLGLVLVLSAIGLVVQAVIARHWAVLAASAIALIAIIGAVFQGISFTSQGQAADSMGMAALTGVALLCYGVTLYLLPSPRAAA